MRHPYMRRHAKLALEALADRQWVERKLVDSREFPPTTYHDIAEALNSLDEAIGPRDFGPLADRVGDVLADAEEATLVTLVWDAWDAVNASVGPQPHGVDDELYFRSPLWPTVVRAAEAALTRIKMRELRYGTGLDPEDLAD